MSLEWSSDNCLISWGSDFIFTLDSDRKCLVSSNGYLCRENYLEKMYEENTFNVVDAEVSQSII